MICFSPGSPGINSPMILLIFLYKKRHLSGKNSKLSCIQSRPKKVKFGCINLQKEKWKNFYQTTLCQIIRNLPLLALTQGQIWEAHVGFATRLAVSVHFGNHFELKLRFRVNPGSSLGIPILISWLSDNNKPSEIFYSEHESTIGSNFKLRSNLNAFNEPRKPSNTFTSWLSM